MKQRNEVGRPPVLDEIKKREICVVLAMGGSRAIAARYVGCHPDTIRNTAQRDLDFALDLERAESKHEVKHLAFINEAAKESKYWRAAAWTLERKYPDRYGARRPDLFTLEQVSHVLDQFAAVMLEEVTETPVRERILLRLSDLTAGLQSSALPGDEP